MHIHPSSPNSMSLLQSEESAAIKIQAGFRGYRVRKQLYQNRFKRSISNGYNLQQRSNFHRRPYSDFQTMEGASSLANNRNNISPSVSEQLCDERSNSSGGSVEDRCATKIQAGVRGFLVRKKQKIATDAATKIQASFRGFKVRKETQKLKQK